jgi:hypothetical protein
VVIAVGCYHLANCYHLGVVEHSTDACCLIDTCAAAGEWRMSLYKCYTNDDTCHLLNLLLCLFKPDYIAMMLKFQVSKFGSVIIQNRVKLPFVELAL